jgi:hypothetical protein
MEARIPVQSPHAYYTRDRKKNPWLSSSFAKENKARGIIPSLERELHRAGRDMHRTKEKAEESTHYPEHKGDSIIQHGDIRTIQTSRSEHISVFHHQLNAPPDAQKEEKITHVLHHKLNPSQMHKKGTPDDCPTSIC